MPDYCIQITTKSTRLSLGVSSYDQIDLYIYICVTSMLEIDFFFCVGDKYISIINLFIVLILSYDILADLQMCK